MFTIKVCFPQGRTVVGTGSGTPEVPELPSARGYSWATMSPGVINTETWSSKFVSLVWGKQPHTIKKLLLRNLTEGQGPIWAVGPLDGWKGLFALHPVPILDNHLLPAFRHCLCNVLTVFLHTHRTSGPMVATPASYSGGPRFKSWPGDRLS
jgi:hypothetical protein